jgi:hypothetical protein
MTKEMVVFGSGLDAEWIECKSLSQAFLPFDDKAIVGLPPDFL